MTTTHAGTHPGSFSRSSSRAQRLARIDRLATLLDARYGIPFTRFRFGVDGLVGLVPGIGDAMTTGLALYIVYQAHKLGAPKHVLARMLGNVALDGLAGAVPIAGDVFDVFWRANKRNVRILREHLDREGLDHRAQKGR